MPCGSAELYSLLHLSSLPPRCGCVYFQYKTDPLTKPLAKFWTTIKKTPVNLMEQKYNKCHLHQYACINKRDKHVALCVSTFHSSKLVCDTDIIGLFSALLQ